MAEVLQLITGPRLRGAELFALRLAEQLRACGWSVDVRALYGPARPGESQPTAAAPACGRRISPLSLQLLYRLARALRRDRPLLVQANGSDTLKYAVLARWLTRSPAKVIYRCISMPSAWLRGPAHRALNGRLFGAVDHVVAVSLASAADVRSTFGLPDTRVTTIPNGVEVPASLERESWRRKLASFTGCSVDAPIVTHVGSFTPEKNHEQLLAAFRRVVAARPTAQLALIGDGPLRIPILRQAEALGLRDRVFAPGAHARAGDLIGGSDLFVLFSTVEGMPGVVLEAGARGVPVIASDVGGTAEVLSTPDAGILVRPGDVDGLAHAAVRLLDDDGTRAAMGGRLRELVATSFEIGFVAGRYAALYRELLAERSP